MLDNIIEYIFVIMEEKYFIEIKRPFICTFEEGLPCICIDEEMLKQAINAMLSFVTVQEVHIRLAIINDAIVPEIYGMAGNFQNGTFRKKINRKQCCKNNGRRYYRIKEYDEIRYNENYYRKHREEIEQKVFIENEQTEHFSRQKRKFILEMFSRIRILHDRKTVHFATCELILLFAPLRMHKLIEELAKTIQCENIKTLNEFLELHIMFLTQLAIKFSEERMRIDFFVLYFRQYFKIDISSIIGNCVQKEKDDFLQVLYDTLRVHLGKTYMNDLKNEILILKEKQNNSNDFNCEKLYSDLKKSNVKRIRNRKGLPKHLY